METLAPVRTTSSRISTPRIHHPPPAYCKSARIVATIISRPETMYTTPKTNGRHVPVIEKFN